MYDTQLARLTIGSPKLAKLARNEARFLIAALGLKKGDRLLDVPCGTGRHSRAFAAAGLAVTGVELNQDCLKLAKTVCRGAGVCLEQGDMSKLSALGPKYRGHFDAVVNLFTSFGYFSTDAGNKRVLKQMVRALKPGGKLVIHTINRDWLLQVFKPIEWHEADGKFTLEARKYNATTKYNEVQSIVLDQRTQRAKVYYHRVRLYSKVEMVRLMTDCGLKQIQIYGDFDGSPFDRLKSAHPIYVGVKGSIQ